MTGLIRRETKKGHTYELDGIAVDGVTTILSGGIPKPALMPWALKSAAQYAVTEWDTLSELSVFERADRIKKAPWRERDEAANRGTEVHSLAEKLMLDEEITVPPALSGYIQSCIEFLYDWDVNPVLTECIVASRQHLYAGTFDALVDISGYGRCLIDFKTNKSGIFPETALQLAAYRYSEFTVIDDQEVSTSSLGIEKTLGVWIRPDGYSVIPLESGEDEFKAFLSAAHTHRWVKHSKHCVGEPLQAVTA